MDVGKERTGGRVQFKNEFIPKIIPHYLGVVTTAIFLSLLPTPENVWDSSENGCAQS